MWHPYVSQLFKKHDLQPIAAPSQYVDVKPYPWPDCKCRGHHKFFRQSSLTKVGKANDFSLEALAIHARRQLTYMAMVGSEKLHHVCELK